MVMIAWQLMMGVGLAASAGLRAFLPLLVVGIAGRLELVELGERFGWMASTPALTVFAVAVVAEILGDKFPVVDHVLDVGGTVARPIAGALVAAAPITTLEPLTAVVIGVILGGAVAGSVHTAKSSARLLSTGTTAGIANPLLSVGEDAASLGGAVISLVLPVVTFTLAIGALFVLFRMTRRRRAQA